jgi:cleavage and polyadenylation specificity factor subunit 2
MWVVPCRVLPRVDAVLLSHPDLPHLGALPLLVRAGLSAPVFSTKPVRRMGEIFLYESFYALRVRLRPQHHCRRMWLALHGLTAAARCRAQEASETQPFSLEEVDTAFRHNADWAEVRFYQRLRLALPPRYQPSGGQDGQEGGAAAGPTRAPGGGITLTPLPAGRTPGGCVWRISLGCGEEVVYALGWNHRRERCAAGAVA